ncbi:hypothetical protein T12_365 [Trichinella patagoniensis]|uniref:Uncharacterized protein n=1 Tax=Trichinella patagoniensis TaxID=990121 RepID=A0A0V0ZLF1_9BILA|nr:hypothetical protein T12_365 [Trichinella patagoniensis]
MQINQTTTFVLVSGESIPLAIGSPTQLIHQPVQRGSSNSNICIQHYGGRRRHQQFGADVHFDEEARKIQNKIYCRQLPAEGERRQAVMEPQRTLGPNWHRQAEALRSATSPYADWSIGHRNRSARGTEKAGRA